MHDYEIYSKYLLKWYWAHRRILPWRNTNDPYKIWLSEIILQQTRVAQGLDYYHRFVLQFPKLELLAEAPLADVLKLWQGLGYYSRARNMHRAAQYIYNDLQGEFPRSFAALLKLPGVGPYTAAAVASIAYNEAVAAVDGNVIRVLARLFNIEQPVDSTPVRNEIQKLAQQLISERFSGDFNQAVMELGAMVCTPRNPSCSDCPLLSLCKACENGTQFRIPVKTKKVVRRNRYFYYLVFKADGKTIIQPRGPNDIWEGLYEFPLIESETELTMVELVEKIQKKHPFVDCREVNFNVHGPVKHILTHQVIQAFFVSINLPNPLADERFVVSLNSVNDYPVSRLIEKYLKFDKNFT